MLIFFGHRSARIESRKVNANTSCEHCQSENSFVASIYGNYFHIFWIPLVSTGKAFVVECSHCKKTYHLQDLSSENQAAIQKSLHENPPKKARWLNLGCFVLVAAALLFACLVIYAIIFKNVRENSGDYDDDYSYESVIVDDDNNLDENVEDVYIDKEPAWLKKVYKDILKAPYSPTIEDEPISYDFRACLDPDALKLMDDETTYFYRIHENKILMLIEAAKFSTLTNKEKETVYIKIDNCLDKILKDENYKRYIGIYQGREFKMQKSPKGIVKDSTAKSSELLKEFYDDLNRF